MKKLDHVLTKGEQISIVMLWNWQLRWNQYVHNSEFAINFGHTLNKTEMILHDLITDVDAKKLMIHKFEEFETLFKSDELKQIRKDRKSK